VPRKPQWPGRRSAPTAAPAPNRPAGPESAGATAGTELTSLLGPVRAGNAFEETVERLLTVIKLGVIPPGDRFPAERELAGLLGVSRITLREAIRALQQAGYVESRRGRFGGTFVTYTRPAPDPGEARRIALADSARLADALAFRMALETGAAQVLAAADGDRGREVLLERLAAVNQAAPEDYRRLDTLFHLAIAELTGSALLATACADARMRLNDLLNAIPVLKHNIVHTAHQHTAIVDAILAGDPERARSAVAEHLDGTGALLRGFLTAPTRSVTPGSRGTPAGRGTVASPVTVPNQDMTAASQEMTVAGQEMRAASQDAGEAP
jgi:DNA-binding FadR family transcriptional regulator